MKHIKKNKEPEAFTKWVKKNPKKSWDEFVKKSGEIKDILNNTLLEEQGYLCCYCECEVSSYHIDHFKPKGKFPKERFSYNNLHISCTTQRDKARCGHKKLEEFSKDLISPLEVDCASHFSYTTTGKIVGLDQRGEETIRICNLNSKALIEMRKSLIDSILFCDDNSREEEIKKHLDSTKPKLGEFYTMIEYLYNNEIFV